MTATTYRGPYKVSVRKKVLAIGHPRRLAGRSTFGSSA